MHFGPNRRGLCSFCSSCGARIPGSVRPGADSARASPATRTRLARMPSAVSLTPAVPPCAVDRISRRPSPSAGAGAVTRSSRRPGRFANDPSDRVARHFQPADAALEPPPSWLPRRWAAGPGLHRELGRPCSTGLWPGPATRVVLYEEMSALSFRLLPWSTPLGRASGSERRQSGRPGAAVSLVWPAPNTPVVRQARKSYPPLATGRRMRTGEAFGRRGRAG